MVDAASTAPVLPADTNASVSPCACSLSPTTMLESCFFRTAASGFSPMPMASLAGRISMRLRSTPGMARELGVDHVGAADELHHERRRQLAERGEGPLDFGFGGPVTAHRVHRDANHPQSSLTSTSFLPR